MPFIFCNFYHPFDENRLKVNVMGDATRCLDLKQKKKQLKNRAGNTLLAQKHDVISTKARLLTMF